MEDKFGFLMKAEAEEHLIREVAEVKKQLASVEPWRPSRYKAIFEIKDRTLRSWGGCPQNKTFKIR